MQELLMVTLLKNGGGAEFETIYADVVHSPSWKLLKKSGSADDKRAILASLSHNPPGNFKKDPKRESSWFVASRAMDWAQRLCDADPSLSLSNVPSNAS